MAPAPHGVDRGDGRGAAPHASRDGSRSALALLALITLLLHFATNGRYGYWGDELYFLACGQHLAWGYVDHPPLIAFIAALSRALMGDSLFAIRFFPATAGASLVFLTGIMARTLGGGRYAVVLSAVATMIAPVYLLFDNLLTMNAFEPLLWMLCAYLVLLMIERPRPALWLPFGIVAGVGLLNKHSMLFFCGALLLGVLLTPQRRILRGHWPWLGAAAGLLIVSPHIVWQIRHGWPTIELLRNAKMYQHQPVSVGEFIGGQVLIMHPLTLPLWVAGLSFLLFSGQGRRYRALGWAYVILFVAFLLLQAKNYYFAPAYPMLFAAGAVAVERVVRVRGWRWMKPLSVTTLILGGIVAAPYVLPILPIEAVPRYLETLRIRVPRPERRLEGAVPQIFADMQGWEEKVAAVARAYRRLSEEDRQRCAIWVPDFSKAGAIDFFGSAYGLPNAISGHQNYYLWGPRGYTGEVMVILGFSADVLRPLFDDLEQTEAVECPYCMPDNSHVPVYIGRGLKRALTDFWPQVKCYTCDRPPFAKAAHHGVAVDDTRIACATFARTSALSPGSARYSRGGPE